MHVLRRDHQPRSSWLCDGDAFKYKYNELIGKIVHDDSQRDAHDVSVFRRGRIEDRQSRFLVALRLLVSDWL
jgi:hypothetical protein